MTALLIPQDTARETYEKLGVVQIRGLIPAAEIDTIREVFTTQVETDPSLGHDDHLESKDVLRRYPRFVHPHRRPDTPAGQLALRYLLDQRIFDVIEALIGPAFAAQSMFYFKPPTARGQALHQDNTFLRTHPETCVAAWIAIDDCDAENGALSVIPGSHRIQLLCLEPADESLSFTNTRVPVPDGVEIEQTVMRAGDVLFFHGSMVHGSTPNSSADRFRRSLIFHYIPQTSVEVAKFYDPLISRAGDQLTIGASPDGGSCGEGWSPGLH